MNNLLYSFIWQFMEKFCSQMVNFIIQIFLARLLEPTDFGNLAIIMALINFFSIFIQSGISTAIVVKPDLEESDVFTALVSSFGVALISYIVLFWISPVIETYYQLAHLSFYIRVLSIVLFFYAINAVYIGILERAMNFRAMFYRSIIAIPISGAAGLLMAYLGYGILSLIMQTLLNQMIFTLILVRKANIKLKCSFSIKRAVYIYRFSTPIMIQSAASELVNIFRSLTISERYSISELAYYDKGATYSNYIYQTINTTIIHVLLPAFSKFQEDRQFLKSAFLKTLRLNCLVSMPVIIGFASVSKTFVKAFLTEKWLLAADFIVLFCIIKMIYVIINLNIQIYYVLKKSNLTLKISLQVSALSLVLLLFTRSISPKAIAAGEVFISILFWIFTMIPMKKELGITLKEQWICCWKTAVSGLLMFMTVYSMNNINMNLWLLLILQLVVGACVYIWLSLLIQMDDLRFLYHYIVNSKIKKGKG